MLTKKIETLKAKYLFIIFLIIYEELFSKVNAKFLKLQKFNILFNIFFGIEVLE
jgi:hypothetical protein